jgi:chromosome segregation ATPase
MGQGIYTCVDAKGRRLTSDRPNIECIDREQTEITPSGQVVRRIKPSLTPEEIAAEEEKQRRAAEERNRQLDEKRRDLALLARYPDKATHDKERQTALVAVDDAIKAAHRRIGELQDERKKLDAQLEFYKGDLSKATPQVRRQFEDNQQTIAAQERFIASKEDEKKRINARYDDELTRLRVLWAKAPKPAAPASAQAAKR